MRAIYIAFIGILAAPSVSLGEPTSLALVPIHGPAHASVTGRLDKALRRTVMESADMAVRAAAAPNATLRMIQDTFECSPAGDNWPNCMADVGKPIGAHRIVWGTLDYRSDRWLLRLRMLDVENRHMVKALERTVADSAGAVDQLMAVAADFVRPADSAAQTRAQLRIVSVPTGAKVAVDGMAISPTPVTVPVAPGAHEVVATVPDLGTERRLVKAGPGETRVSFRFIEPTATPEAVVEELPDLVLDWRFWGGLGSISAAAIGAAGFLHFGTEANADRSQAMQLLNSAELGPNSAPAFTSEQRDRYQNLQSSFEQNNSYRYSCFFAAITAGIAGGVLFHLWAADGATVAPTPNGVAVSGTF